MARERQVKHPGAQPDCRMCNGLGSVLVPQGEVTATAPCDCVQPCPRCKGTGFVAQSAAFRAPRVRCACRVAQARADAIDAVGIPARHATSSLASYHPQDMRQTAIMGQVHSYISEYEAGEPNRGVVLFGPVGVGKTHLLVAMLRSLVAEKGVRARFVEFSHLLADLKAGFDRGQGTAALIDPLVDVELLGIDELGKGRATEFEETVIDEIISRRYNAMRPVLATTNFSDRPPTGRRVGNAAQGEASMPTLADRVGPRVYSRLVQTCDFFGVTGEDYRARKRKRRRRGV